MLLLMDGSCRKKRGGNSNSQEEPFWLKKLKEAGISVQGITEEDVCKLENPYNPLFEYQDKIIEHKEPFAPYFFTLIEGAGDIYRELTQRINPSYSYIDEKINRYLDQINRFGEYELQRIAEDLSKPEVKEKMKKYQQDVDEWEKITDSYPDCADESMKEARLQVIKLNKLLTRWGMMLTQINAKDERKALLNLMRNTVNQSRKHLNEFNDAVIYKREMGKARQKIRREHDLLE